MSHENKHEPHNNSTEATAEEMYAAFLPNQKKLASGLLDGIYGLADDDTIYPLYLKYASNTAAYTYIEPEQQEAVMDYVADRIDESFLEGSRTIDTNHASHAGGEKAVQTARLAILDTAFGRYEKLANYTAHGPSHETFTRIYPVMRNFFRSAGTMAVLREDTDLLQSWQKRWRWFASGHEKDIAGHELEYESREDTYETFKKKPESQKTWQDVEDEALVEEAYGEIFDVDMTKVSARDMIALAERIRNVLPEDYYKIIAEVSPGGDRWMDILHGLKHRSLQHAFRRFTDVILPFDETQPEDGPKKWDTVVEIGAKDAKSTEAFSFDGEQQIDKYHVRIGRPIADKFVVIEPDQTMIDLAKDKLAGRNVEFIHGEVMRLPFDDGSIDLAFGDRLLPSLNAPASEDFYKEIARILNNGGMYIDGVAEDIELPLVNSVTNRWKNLLAQMVADTVTGSTIKREQLDPTEEASLLEDLGLKVYHYKYDSNNIRVFVKNGEIEDAGYLGVQGRGVDHYFRVVRSENDR